MVLLLWQHGDMTGIPPQVVQSYKCFNGKLNSHFKARFLQSNKNGKVQEAVVLVLPYSSVFRLTTETVQ